MLSGKASWPGRLRGKGAVMKRFIIGTAGHIDHGKTTLVKALTGIETDRLKEEKQRGISIELGFAPFVLPGGQKAAIVDVPGHERFIRHMLAGAFGIDMVLFIIAADEGVMPQTREHMDIIELLGVDKGVVVITKKDLVDEEWLMLVEDEIHEYLKKTILKDAPVIAVSGVTKDGLPELLGVVESIADTVEEKSAFGHARIPIDRVFTMAGFGTVVTGTLWSGTIEVGDTLELMPVGRAVKVRTLQVHGQKVPRAMAGQRVAVNLQGIEVADIKRGDLLATPGYLTPSYRVDARLRVLPSSKRSLKNWNRIRFHLGTDEAMGRIVLLDRDEANPGDETLVQIVMEKPVVAFKGDPFVIRYYSPVTTIGGGTIIDPAAPKQKRFKEEVLNELSMKEEGSLYDRVLYELESNPEEVLSLEELTRRTGSSREALQQEIQALIDEERIIDLKQLEFISAYGLEQITDKITGQLRLYHQQYPLRRGYPREDMRSRYFKQLNVKFFTQVLKELEERGAVKSHSNQLALPSHIPAPDPKQEEAIKQVLKCMNSDLFAPPSAEEIRQKVAMDEGEWGEIWGYLLEKGLLVRITQEMYFSAQALDEAKKRLNQFFDREKELSLATARDIFNTSRKYALPLIEYFDRMRYTRRIGDVRVKA